ncbi:collagen alpha-1(I) chain-like [Passer montanus]|uniref:collagen alpha-1(I) chain-like n=1 Tax=Passer montanus TaxID=9160 RepID=UPI001960FAD8|nr:collagen alpha-1(I) chain-like [Passer montanus]
MPPNLGTPPSIWSPLTLGAPCVLRTPRVSGTPRILGTPPDPLKGFGDTRGGCPAPPQLLGFPSFSMGGPQNFLGDPKLGGAEGNTPFPPPLHLGVPPGFGGPPPPPPQILPNQLWVECVKPTKPEPEGTRGHQGPPWATGATVGHPGPATGPSGATQGHHRVTVATKETARAVKGHPGPPDGHHRVTMGMARGPPRGHHRASTARARRWLGPPQGVRGWPPPPWGTARATKGYHQDGQGHHRKSQGTATATTGPPAPWWHCGHHRGDQGHQRDQRRARAMEGVAGVAMGTVRVAMGTVRATTGSGPPWGWSRTGTNKGDTSSWSHHLCLGGHGDTGGGHRDGIAGH